MCICAADTQTHRIVRSLARYLQPLPFIHPPHSPLGYQYLRIEFGYFSSFYGFCLSTPCDSYSLLGSLSIAMKVWRQIGNRLKREFLTFYAEKGTDPQTQKDIEQTLSLTHTLRLSLYDRKNH